MGNMGNEAKHWRLQTRGLMAVGALLVSTRAWAQPSAAEETPPPVPAEPAAEPSAPPAAPPTTEPPPVSTGPAPAGEVKTVTEPAPTAGSYEVAEPAPVKEYEPPKPRGPFDQGSVRVSIVLGGGENLTSSYLILGAGVGYFVLDGLELEADAQAWLFGDPFTATITPGLNYVFYMVPKVNPYVCIFYRHYFIDEFDDFDAYGARAGLLLRIGPNGYLGGGAAYERRFNCDNTQFRDSCDQWYPEITFSLSF
jgi:hypothetical protein